MLLWGLATVAILMQSLYIESAESFAIPQRSLAQIFPNEPHQSKFSLLLLAASRADEDTGSPAQDSSRPAKKQKVNPPNPSIPDDFFLRPMLISDIGFASDMLTASFFKKGTNFVTYQIEKVKTYLSMEAGFPKRGDKHQIFVACQKAKGNVVAMVEVDARPPKDKPYLSQNELSEIKKNSNSENNDASGKSLSFNDDSQPINSYMCNLAVDERFWRNGIASALVRLVEQQVLVWNSETEGKILNSVFLKVWTDNDAAIAMYERLGYTRVTNEIDKEGKPILVMQKSPLKPAEE